jgi:hypothetical protein
MAKVNQIMIVVEGIGGFTIDSYMGVWFDNEEGHVLGNACLYVK